MYVWCMCGGGVLCMCGLWFLCGARVVPGVLRMCSAWCLVLVCLINYILYHNFKDFSIFVNDCCLCF